MKDSSIKRVKGRKRNNSQVILLQLHLSHGTVTAPWEDRHKPRPCCLFDLCFSPPPKIFPLSSSFYQGWALREAGEMRMEPHHYGSNSGETTWQEAALQVSSSGHHFPSSCPVTMAHCALLFAQGLDTHLKSSRPSHLLRLKVPSSRKRWGNEAVKRKYLTQGVKILSPSSYSSCQQRQIVFKVWLLNGCL